jgi:hypothetical protein
MLTMRRIGLALLVLAAGCTSEEKDPRKTAAASTRPLEIEAEARGLVDSLSADHVIEWVQNVGELTPPVRSAVGRELARRAVAVLEKEKDPGEKTGGEPKEVHAIRLMKEAGEVAPADFVDYDVWAAAHRGRAGFEDIWALGLRAFPAVLKLRGDRHPAVRQAIGALVRDSIVGGRRWRASGDAELAALCNDELPRCPPAHRPHYRAIQATLGDADALDAFPDLLKSDLVGDQVFAHLLLEGMFAKGSPYAGQELKAVALAQQDDGWRALSKRALAWWEKNRDRLAYDPKAGFWVLQ